MAGLGGGIWDTVIGDCVGVFLGERGGRKMKRKGFWWKGICVENVVNFFERKKRKNLSEVLSKILASTQKGETKKRKKEKKKETNNSKKRQS